MLYSILRTGSSQMVRKLLLVAVATSILLVTSCMTPPEVTESSGSDAQSNADSSSAHLDTDADGSVSTAGNGEDSREDRGKEDTGAGDPSVHPAEDLPHPAELSRSRESQANVGKDAPIPPAIANDPISEARAVVGVRPDRSFELPAPPVRGDSAFSARPDYWWQEVSERVASLDLETQIGQLLMIQFRVDADGRPIREVTPGVRQLIETIQPGGVILFAENISTPEQTARFIRELQAASEIPLFISVDEEGGFVSRLNRSGALGATRVPSAATVGRTGDPEYARRVGRLIGTELRVLGINMNMAPVADVNTNPKSGIIAKYERSFGGDPALVGEMVAAMVEGLQATGVSAVLKHFPGHGDTELDTHTGAVVSDSSLDRLRAVELVPFQYGISAGADAVMTAHIAYPTITGTNRPATFSRALLIDVLRDELGFRGVVISDALEMGAVASSDLEADPVVAAVAAGVDLVLSPRDPLGAHEALVTAVADGTLSRGRVRRAAEHVLRAKVRRGLFGPSTVPPHNPSDVLGSDEHARIMEELLERASREDDR